MRRTTTIVQARADDLEDGDVVSIDGRWRIIMDVCRNREDAGRQYGAEDNWHPGLRGALEAIEQRWEGDYVIVRYVVQEKSTGTEVEDGVTWMDSSALLNVQVSTETARKAPAREVDAEALATQLLASGGEVTVSLWGDRALTRNELVNVLAEYMGAE